MLTKRSLGRSISNTIGLLASVQIVFFSALALAFRLALENWILFMGVSLSYHGLLLLAMVRLRYLFVYIENHEELTRVNISNVLSLFRLSSLPTILFMLINTKKAALALVIIPFILIVFLSDLVDGYLARRLHQITRIGRYLDSTSDYFILFGIGLILLWDRILHPWFFALLLIRLLVMAVGNTIILVRQGHVEPHSSYLGKASIFGVMGIFALKVLEYTLSLFIIELSWNQTLRLISEKMVYMVAGVLIVAILEKFYLLNLVFKTMTRQKK